MVVAFRAGPRRVPRAFSVVSRLVIAFVLALALPDFLGWFYCIYFPRVLRLANIFSMYHVLCPGLDRAAILPFSI